MIKFLGQVISFIGDIWKAFPFQVRVVTIAGVGLLVVLLLVFGQMSSCRSRRQEKKIDRIEANIQRSEIEANVLSNSFKEAIGNAKNTNTDLDRVLGTDSRSRESDFSTVKRKWCRDHAGDSKCREQQR